MNSKGASIHTHAIARTTPLWTAVSEQNLPMVRYLVENGAKLDSPKCSYGFSPFHLAVKSGNAEIVKFIIEKGADITVKGNEEWFGETVFEIAQKGMDSGKYEYEIKENKEKYGKIIAMLKAAEEDSKNNDVAKNVEDIIEEFVLSEGLKYQNISRLGMAVIQNDIEAVKSNLANGCNVNFYECERKGGAGWTPLILACNHSSLDIVKLLVEHPGVDLDITTKENEEVH